MSKPLPWSEEINIPRKPLYDCIHEGDGNFRLVIICSACRYRLKMKAPRCPECGQLFNYEAV